MLTFRCTQKLLSTLKVTAPADPPPSTTELGDWYGNTLFVGHLRLVIFISESTMLPVVITLRESRTLVPRFRSALAEVLQVLRLPTGIIEREVDAQGSAAFGRTANRRVVGVMNELAFHAKAALDFGSCGSPLELSLRLGGVLIGPVKYIHPADEAVRRLTGSSGDGRRAI